MFINPILGMFIHLSQLGLHQPLVLRFLFRCRNKKKHIPAINPTPETSHRTTSTPNGGGREGMNPRRTSGDMLAIMFCACFIISGENMALFRHLCGAASTWRQGGNAVTCTSRSMCWRPWTLHVCLF